DVERELPAGGVSVSLQLQSIHPAPEGLGEGLRERPQPRLWILLLEGMQKLLGRATELHGAEAAIRSRHQHHAQRGSRGGVVDPGVAASLLILNRCHAEGFIGTLIDAARRAVSGLVDRFRNGLAITEVSLEVLHAAGVMVLLWCEADDCAERAQQM